ncbi:MAG: DUF4363 family protein [Clostridiales bacterium]|nr:DUF4363 family protein [Clostridiales bacterium]
MLFTRKKPPGHHFYREYGGCKMVKNLITAAISLLIVFLLCFAEAKVQTSAFSKMHTALTEVYQKAMEETATEEDGKALRLLWERQKNKLHVFIPHTDIREMDLWISEAIYYLGDKDYDEACGKLEVLIHSCENVPKTYDFSLENFL